MNATTALVPVFTAELQGEPTPLCNARDLHAVLKVGRDFSNWIKGRIAEYGFVEGEDFFPVPPSRFSPDLAKTPKGSKGGRPTTDYHLTLDMAKELAMVENNTKGREVRRYFIAVEKRTRQASGHGLATISQQIAAHRQRLILLKELFKTHDPVLRMAIHEQLDHASRLLGLSTPALDEIGLSIVPDHESPLLDEFWEAFDLLATNPDNPLNHARSHGLLAINLPQVRAAAGAARVPLPDMIELRRLLRASRSPRFIAIKAMNSPHVNGTVKCWVFANETASSMVQA